MENYRHDGLTMGVLIVGLFLTWSVGWAQSPNISPEHQQVAQESSKGKQAKPLPGKKIRKPKRQQGHNAGQGARKNAFTWEGNRDSLLIGTELLGRPTDHSITINVVPREELELFFEYGTESGVYTIKTDTFIAPANTPLDVIFDDLQPNTRYYYRMRYRKAGEAEFQARDEFTFHTQRPPGSTFTFAIQGDSHPERDHQNDPELYTRTLLNAASDNPDFYMTIGDDFSIDKLKTVTPEAIEQIYLNQRRYFGLVANSAPLFLVNGNHEQGAAYLLDGTPDSPAVWVQNTRNRYYPQPAPDDFYTGDTQAVEHIGLLRDYYAWTWGDALFIVLDPYWHSPVPVNNTLGSLARNRDMWAITLGDDQYQWFKQTLEQSEAAFKFVFAHHVLGTGRGGIEMADLYEWGGKNKKGVWEFDQKRPGWELPIHQLMAKHDVTIFFHGHDHLFAHQELDGVMYQELPVPADPLYRTDNEDAYTSGVKMPNSGYVRVSVSASEVTVDYVRSWLPQDETGEHKNGEVAYSYTIKAE